MKPKDENLASTESIDKEFAELCETYRATIPQKSDTVQKLIEQVITDLAKRNPPHFKELEKQVHKLAGSSGSYGFTILSDLSRMLEQNISSGKLGELNPEDCVSFLRFWYALFSEQARLASQKKSSPTTSEKLGILIEWQLKSKLSKKEDAA